MRNKGFHRLLVKSGLGKDLCAKTKKGFFKNSGEVFMNISVDGSLLIQILNFVVLIVALNLVLYKPIRKILGERKNSMDGLAEEIIRLQAEGTACVESVKAGLKKARILGVTEKDAVIERAKNREKDRLANVEADLRREQESFRKRVASEVDEARKTLQKQVDDFAMTIAEKILGRTV